MHHRDEGAGGGERGDGGHSCFVFVYFLCASIYVQVSTSAVVQPVQQVSLCRWRTAGLTDSIAARLGTWGCWHGDEMGYHFIHVSIVSLLAVAITIVLP